MDMSESLPRGASQLLLPLSREAAAPRLPPLPQAGPEGARRDSRGRRVRGQWPPSSLRDLPLAWASPPSPARCSFFPSSSGVLFGRRGGQHLARRGCPSGWGGPCGGPMFPPILSPCPLSALGRGSSSMRTCCCPVCVASCPRGRVPEGKIGLPRANPRGRLRSPSYPTRCFYSSVFSPQSHLTTIHNF